MVVNSRVEFFNFFFIFIIYIFNFTRKIRKTLKIRDDRSGCCKIYLPRMKYLLLNICSNKGTKKAMYIDKSGSSSWIRRKPLSIKLYLINFSTEFEFLCGNMHGVTFTFCQEVRAFFNS